MIDEVMALVDENFVAIILSLGGLVAGIWIYKHFLENEKFAGTDIEERVKDSLYDVLTSVGKSLNTVVRYRLDVLGVIDRAYHYSIKPRKVKEKKKGKKANVKDSEGKDMELFTDTKEWELFNVRPRANSLSGLINYLAWGLFDKIAGLGWFEKIFLVPSKLIERRDSIVVDKEVDFTKIAGLFVPRNSNGKEAVQVEAFISNYVDTLERFSNLVNYMNFLDREFSKSIQEMEKKYSLEREKWSKREEGVVENG